MFVSGVSERADDIQSVFGVCVNFVCVLFDVIPLSNVTPRVLVLCVTEIGVLFSVTCGCVLRNECEGGFVCGDLRSIIGETLF